MYGHLITRHDLITQLIITEGTVTVHICTQYKPVRTKFNIKLKLLGAASVSVTYNLVCMLQLLDEPGIDFSDSLQE